MKKNEKNTIFIYSIFLISLFSCKNSEKSKDEKAIFESDENDKNFQIKKSPDQLQFKKIGKDLDVVPSVGFSKEGHISYEGDFKNGKAEGLWTTFFPDGKPRWQGIKKQGVNDGPFTLWYENGRKKLEGSYFKGKKHGLIIAWHPNGSKWQHKFYKEGNPAGTWKTWDKNGNITAEVSYP